MTKHFPQGMIDAARLGKKSFFSEVQAGPGDCLNCGGLGSLVLFVASEGPYPTPAAPYRGDGKVSKFYDGKWWIGNSHSFVCPECNGLGKTGYKQAGFKQVPSMNSAVDNMTSWRKDESR